jgi:hypothetical protein
MKRSIFYLLVCAIAVSISMSGCKKDDSSDKSSPADLPKPAFASETKVVEVPANLQTSQEFGAQMCNTYLNMVNGLSAWTGFFSVPDNAQELKSATKSTGTRTYKYSNGLETVYYEYTETSDKYCWTMYFETKDHPKAKVIYAEESKNGATGKVEIYNWDTDKSTSLRWSWTKDASNNTTFIYDVIGTGDKIEVKANADGSGYVKLYENSVLTMYGNWNTLGHGTLIMYATSGDVSYTF